MDQFLKSLENEKTQILSLFTLSFLVFYTKLWQGPLAGDEACYALLSRQILRTGDWIVLHHPYYSAWKNFYEHPPLYMWCTAINFKLFGISDWSAKLFSTTTGFASVLLIYLTGKKMVDHRFGFISAFMLLTTIYFIDYSRKARLEIPLTFFILLSFFFLIICLKNRKYLWAFFSGNAAALAFLVKGVPALATLFPAFFAFIFLTESFKRSLSNIAFFILGICTFIVPWVFAQFYFDNGRFFDWYIYKQVGWSMAGRGRAAAKAPMSFSQLIFYPKKLLLEIMAPWSLFSIFGVIELIKRKKFKINAIKYLSLIGASIIVLSFSLVEFKKTRYVLPAVPFLALLATEFFINRTWIDVFIRWISRAVLLITCGLIIIATLTPIQFYSKKDSDLLTLIPYVSNYASNGDSLLVYGLKPYTVRQEFSWYFDRPQKIIATEESFKKEWQTNKFKIGIWRHSVASNTAMMIKNEHPFLKSGPYLLFANRNIINSATINLNKQYQNKH